MRMKSKLDSLENIRMNVSRWAHFSSVFKIIFKFLNLNDFISPINPFRRYNGCLHIVPCYCWCCYCFGPRMHGTPTTRQPERYMTHCIIVSHIQNTHTPRHILRVRNKQATFSLTFLWCALSAYRAVQARFCHIFFLFFSRSLSDKLDANDGWTIFIFKSRVIFLLLTVGLLLAWIGSKICVSKFR